MKSPEQSFTDRAETPPEKDGVFIHLLAGVPALLFLSFFSQAIHARLILGRSPRTCLDEIPDRLFEAHHFAGCLFFYSACLCVCPLCSWFWCCGNSGVNPSGILDAFFGVA